MTGRIPITQVEREEAIDFFSREDLAMLSAHLRAVLGSHPVDSTCDCPGIEAIAIVLRLANRKGGL